jgi:hypothetical protein
MACLACESDEITSRIGQPLSILENDRAKEAVAELMVTRYWETRTL